jgi:hypothetical protein
VYLASYYSGGLAGSIVLGQIFDRLGWNATVTAIGIAFVAAAFLATQLTQPMRLAARPAVSNP